VFPVPAELEPEIAEMIRTAEHALNIVSCAENYPDEPHRLSVAVVDLAAIIEGLERLRGRP